MNRAREMGETSLFFRGRRHYYCYCYRDFSSVLRCKFHTKVVPLQGLKPLCLAALNVGAEAPTPECLFDELLTQDTSGKHYGVPDFHATLPFLAQTAIAVHAAKTCTDAATTAFSRCPNGFEEDARG